MTMQTFQAPDPDFAVRVRDSFARQKAMALIGARMTRIEPGLVQITLPFRDDLTQQHGFFHGGFVSAIADSAGGYAAFSLFPADASVLTVEYKIVLLAPSVGDELIATGRVIRPGRQLTFCELTVDSVCKGHKTRSAHGLQTIICLEGRSDHRRDAAPSLSPAIGAR